MEKQRNQFGIRCCWHDENSAAKLVFYLLTNAWELGIVINRVVFCRRLRPETEREHSRNIGWVGGVNGAGAYIARGIRNQIYFSSLNNFGKQTALE